MTATAPAEKNDIRTRNATSLRKQLAEFDRLLMLIEAEGKTGEIGLTLQVNKGRINRSERRFVERDCE